MQLRWLREQWAVALISWTEGSKPGERAEVRQSPVAQQQNTPYTCERSPAKQPITNKKTDSTLGFTAELPFRGGLIWTTYSGDFVKLQKRQMSRRGLKSVMYASEKPPCVRALTETVHLIHMHTQHTHPESMLVGRGSGGGARGDGTKPVWNTNTEHLWAISTWLRLLHGYGWSIQDSWVLQLSEFLFSHEWIDGSRYNDKIKWASCASWYSIHSFHLSISAAL